MRLNNNFNFPLGGIKYIVINKRMGPSQTSTQNSAFSKTVSQTCPHPAKKRSHVQVAPIAGQTENPHHCPDTHFSQHSKFLVVKKNPDLKKKKKKRKKERKSCNINAQM